MTLVTSNQAMQTPSLALLDTIIDNGRSIQLAICVLSFFYARLIIIYYRLISTP